MNSLGHLTRSKATSLQINVISLLNYHFLQFTRPDQIRHSLEIIFLLKYVLD